jgi:hypothetical protein
MNTTKFLIILFWVIFINCQLQGQNHTAGKDSITYLSFKTNNGWGYDIYINDKKYIHQDYIPAVNGKKSFKTKEDAEKTAVLVKNKIMKKIIPPSVTINELESLGIK